MEKPTFDDGGILPLIMHCRMFCPGKTDDDLRTGLTEMIASLNGKKNMESRAPKAEPSVPKDTQHNLKNIKLSKDTHMEDTQNDLNAPSPMEENALSKDNEGMETVSPMPKELLDLFTRHLKAGGLSDNLIDHIHRTATQTSQPKKKASPDTQQDDKENPAAAMDAACMNLFTERQKAKEIVKPLVGNIIAMDSAAPEEIYRYALKASGVCHDGANLAGLKALALLKANEKSPRQAAMAADSALKKKLDLNEIFGIKKS